MAEQIQTPIETLTLPQQIEIGENQAAIMRLNPEPWGTIVDADGKPRQVIAAVEIPDVVYGSPDQTSTIVCFSLQPGPKKKSDPELVATRMRYDQNGKLVAVQPHPYDPQRRNSMYDDDPGYQFNATLIPPTKRGQRPTQALITFKPERYFAPKETSPLNPNFLDSPKGPRCLPAVLARDALDTQVMDKGDAWKVLTTSEKERTRHNRHRIIVKAAAWIGLLAAGGGTAAGTLQTGGFYDKALDLQHSAGDFVDRTFQSHNPEEQAAIDRVAEIMEDWDVGKFDEIEAKAAQFEAQHAGDLMPREQLANFQERITKATTHKQVTQVLDEFMRFYGKDAISDNFGNSYETRSEIFPLNQKDTALQNTQATALGIVSAVSLFPRSIFSETFNIYRFELGTGRHSKGPEGVKDTRTAGEYVQTSYNDLGYVRIAVPIEPADPQTVQDQTVKTTLHELNHSRKDRVYDPGAITGYLGNEEQQKEFAEKEFWDQPVDPSIYGMASGGDERDSDVFAYAFTPGSRNRFASPDAVRRFESKLGVDMLRELIEWETRSPGMGAWIITHKGAGFQAPWYTSWLNYA